MDSAISPSTALMLPGGGARGAYQIGALKAIAQICPERNPFPIIAGTSAGAINAAVVASHADRFAYGVERLEYFWGNMRCNRIYRTDWRSVLQNTAHWIAGAVFGRLGLSGPDALLDTQPLRALLKNETKLSNISRCIEEGVLRAAAVTASGYTTADAVTLYQALPETKPWRKGRRRGEPSEINVEHLMASAALPLLFPPIALHHQYYIDGGLRQTAPLSPAIHLGAERILIITTRDEHPDPEPQSLPKRPGMGDIAGYMLDIVFMDSLQADLDRLHRINHTLSLLPEASRQSTNLKHIDTLVIRPSVDVRNTANRFREQMPASIKLLLGALGALGPDSRLPSYLLFDQDYCRTLMELGYHDAMGQRDAIHQFLQV